MTTPATADTPAHAGLAGWDSFIDGLAALDTTDLKAVRGALAEGQRRIAEAFTADEATITRLVRARGQVIDAVLRQSWAQLVATEHACLVAVGGYGRNELLPQSDIDLLVLYQADQFDTAKPGIERFLTHLWDLGLEIGHAVRTPAECACASSSARNTVTV